MKHCIIFALILFLHTPAQAADPVEKTLKTLITAVRYGKDDLATRQIAFSRMAERLLPSTWTTMPDAQRQELSRGIETLVRKNAFKKGRDLFEHLDAVLYDAPRINGPEARCKSTVVVYRNYKKAEIIIDWVLVPDNGQWKVVDTVMLGESTLEGIREDQVNPLLKEGGVNTLLAALRRKLAESK